MASHTRLFTVVNMTSGTGTATNTLLTTSQYMAIKGASGTQRIDVNEVLLSGFASSSAAAGLMLSHASVIETTPTALATATASDGPMDSSAGALASAPVTFIAAATQPTTTNNTTDPRLNLGLNLNGGIIRWVAAPGMNWTQLGNTATLGESVLAVLGTGFTSGTFSGHIAYEPF
jgi:hypothetical protein